MTSTRFIIYGYNNGNNSQPWNDRLGSLANERVYPSFHILNATMFIMARAIISRTFFLKNFVDTSREYTFHLIFFLLKFSKLLISIEKKKVFSESDFVLRFTKITITDRVSTGRIENERHFALE